MSVVYHYTTAAGLAGILRDRAIEPRTASHRFDNFGAPAAVWFSSNRTWELACSATVGIGPGGELPRGVVPGHAFEAARITVRKSDTEPWQAGLLKHGVHWSVLLRLYSTAVDFGSDPTQWRVSLQPLLMERWTKVELWNDENWVALPVDGGFFTVAGLMNMAVAAVPGIAIAKEIGGRRDAV
ncbi:MAG: hypothetical protein PHW08_09835 [Kiritimatiellae bacterium]|nr:hypothetical protein [Kiritimatiellia bacterium]